MYQYLALHLPRRLISFRSAKPRLGCSGSLETLVFIEREPVLPSQMSVFIERSSFRSTSPCSKHLYLSSGRRFDLCKRRTSVFIERVSFLSESACSILAERSLAVAIEVSGRNCRSRFKRLLFCSLPLKLFSVHGHARVHTSISIYT